MANKRQLKKRISYVCGELAGEIITAYHILNGLDTAAVNKVVCDIAALQTHARRNVNVAFDKAPRDFANRCDYNKARRAYYKAAYSSLRKEFGEKVLAIVKEMNAAIPESERQKIKSL